MAHGDFDNSFADDYSAQFGSDVPKNQCSPANVFGGFQHYLFLGASVVSFSASVGWNNQTTEITVQLLCR